MSVTLMQGLAIAGGVVLAGVIAHGVWSARKASPRLPEGHSDSRLEPVLGGAAAVTRAPEDAAADMAEAEGAAQALGELRPPVVPRKTARLDPLIDAIAMLRLESAVTGESALMHLPPTRRAGTKPFLIEGLNADSGEFELPAPGQRYTEFQAGVQMANRSGALNEIEYSEFVQKLQAFAESVGAMVDLPDMLEVVGHARELDAFASAHDAQLAVVLRANQAAWTVGYLQQAAGRHGFVPGVLPGRLVLPGAEEGAPPVLVLGFDAQAALADDPSVAAVRSITLSLDVPQTPESVEPYPAWQDAARRLAAEIDATVCDDAGRPITLQAFVGIGEDLKMLYQALEQRDLAAGSPAARRLFS
ncbi:cell division protein FtsZ [Ideonella sp. DXS22W]|uniref:Cell division protein FtsZ n=1 Tax=Pseudaquabacterium inlustre TaxID=2984192 RepID=A0ABU9CK89_9BURK